MNHFAVVVLFALSMSVASPEDLTLHSGRRVTPSPRVVLPIYVCAAMPTDELSWNAVGTSFGMEMAGLRLSARSIPLEANLGLRWRYVFQPAGSVFYLGVPLRAACKFGSRSKVYAGTAAGKLMEDIPSEEKNKRKHELWAFARSAWINLRRIVLFQSKNAPEGTNGPHDGLLSAVLASLKTMSQTLEHLKFYFSGHGFRPAMVAAGLKY